MILNRPKIQTVLGWVETTHQGTIYEPRFFFGGLSELSAFGVNMFDYLEPYVKRCQWGATLVEI